MDRKTIEVQKAIVDGHSSDESSLLTKYPSSSLGHGIQPNTVSASYALSGLVNRDQHVFLPHFEFNVETHYGVNISSESMLGEEIYLGEDRIGLALKGRNTGRVIRVTFPAIKDLFYLRNLSSEGQLSSIARVREAERDEVPIEESQIRAGFYFRASSGTHGQLTAGMEIDHPAAEKLIRRYLATIDRRFDDYRGLEEHFREKDDFGTILWEDQNLQSPKYYEERDKLHNALFGDLTAVLKSGDLDYKMS